MGISLFTDETQTQYKDLVVYFGEIADVMDEISAKDKQELLELLFGKNRANAGAALLTNYDQVYKVIDTIKNSAGSAEKEINTMRESLDFSINAFKESWTEIGQTAIDRDGLKTIVDIGTSGLNVLNEIIKKLGVIPALITAIVGISTLKNGSGRSRFDSPYKYARITLLVTVNEVRLDMVA